MTFKINFLHLKSQNKGTRMKSIHRFLQHVLLVWFCLCLSILATGCGPKKYSFTIDAPPAYANEYSFKQMKIEPFQSNRRAYGRAMQTLLASRIHA